MLIGGANRDGVVDGRDLIWVKKIILDLEQTTLSADANQDGGINGADLIRIKKIILGIGW